MPGLGLLGYGSRGLATLPKSSALRAPADPMPLVSFPSSVVPGDGQLEAVWFGPNGERRDLGWIEPRVLAQKYKLPLRSVTQLRAGRRAPSIESHGTGQLCCILVRMGSIQALILTDHVVMLCTPGAHGVTSVLEDVEWHLAQSESEGESDVGSSRSRPFELVALDAIMSSAFARYRRRLGIVEPLARELSQRMLENGVGGNSAPVGWMWRLLPLRETLSSLEVHLLGIRDTLDQLMDEDEDMLRLLISERRTLAADVLPAIDRHGEVEMCMVRYLGDASDLYARVRLLRLSIEASVELLNTALDADRNRLMHMNLRVSVGTLGVGCGALITAAFGMNLPHGLLNTPETFWALATGAVAFSVGTVMALRRMHSPRGEMLAEVHGAAAMKIVYDNIDNLSEQLRRHLRANGHLRVADVAPLLARAHIRADVKPNDLEILFEALDENREQIEEDGELDEEDSSSADPKGAALVEGLRPDQQQQQQQAQHQQQFLHHEQGPQPPREPEQPPAVVHAEAKK